MSKPYKIIYKEITIRNRHINLEKACSRKGNISFLLEFQHKILNTCHKIHVPTLWHGSKYDFTKVHKPSATGAYINFMLTGPFVYI